MEKTIYIVMTLTVVFLLIVFAFVLFAIWTKKKHPQRIEQLNAAYLGYRIEERAGWLADVVEDAVIAGVFIAISTFTFTYLFMSGESIVPPSGEVNPDRPESIVVPFAILMVTATSAFSCRLFKFKLPATPTGMAVGVMQGIGAAYLMMVAAYGASLPMAVVILLIIVAVGGLMSFIGWALFLPIPRREIINKPEGYKAWLDVDPGKPRRRFTYTIRPKNQLGYILKALILGYASLGYKSTRFMVGMQNERYVSFERVIVTDSQIQIKIAVSEMEKDKVRSLLPNGVNVHDLIAHKTLVELSRFPERLITSPHNPPEIGGENFPLDNGVWIVIHKVGKDA